MKIDVLDHGYVKLIEAWGHGSSYGATHEVKKIQNSVTGRITEIEAFDVPLKSDHEAGIIEAARQSTQGSFRGWDQDQRLLKYLYEHQHATPFEFAGMVIEVQAPLFVFREWHRHRTQCLAGDSRLVFDLPNGKPHYLAIRDVARRWHASPPKRQRHERTLAEFDRARIGAMRLRSPTGHVSIVDTWPSGEKRVYRLITSRGEVTCSADHLLKTPRGWARLADSPREVMVLMQDGFAMTPRTPHFSRGELRAERWVEVADGYEVSDLGRVRSYWTTRAKRAQPRLKALVPNVAGRLIAGVAGEAQQVSRLVWNAFVGAPRAHVLHRDGNAWNNRLVNLCDATEMQNAADRVRHDAQTRLREVAVSVSSIRRAGLAETFDITVTGDHAFVAGGIVVHNSYNEMSARYEPLPDLYYRPDPMNVYQRAKAANTGTRNRQAQASSEAPPLTLESASYFVSRHVKQVYDLAEEVYQAALAAGVPKELARIVMPVGHYSRMRAAANLRNWLAFLTLRRAPNAQWEIREYAKAVGQCIAMTFPRTWALFTEKDVDE